MEIPFTDSVSNLIASFNFRRAIALISILVILGGAAWTVDYYSDFSRLSRLERATTLLERLHALDTKGIGNDLAPVRERLSEELRTIVAKPEVTPNEGPGSFRGWFSRVWKKFVAGASPWFLFSLVLLPSAFRGEKNALAGFFGFQVLTIFFGTVIATIPPVGYAVVDYLLIPWGLLVLVAVVPMSITAVTAYKKVRDSSLERAIKNNLRQLSAAADQYFLEKGESLVAAKDLVGPEHTKYIKALTSIDGERYDDLVIVQGEPISVARRSGERVTYANG